VPKTEQNSLRQFKIKRQSQINLIPNIWKLLIIAGLVCLIFSVINTSIILGYAGLGLIFWGSLLVYVTTEQYVKKELLIASLSPSIIQLKKTLKNLGYDGKTTYLPHTISNFENCKILITRERNFSIVEMLTNIQKINEYIFNNTDFLLLQPKGLDLMKLFEKRIRNDFVNLNLNYLEKHLSAIIMNDFELAEDFKFIIKTNDIAEKSKIKNNETTQIIVEIKNSIFNEIYEKSFDDSFSYFDDCPLISAIGCILTKTTGDIIEIEELSFFKKERTIRVLYTINKIRKLEKVDFTPKKPVQMFSDIKFYSTPKSILFFIALGTIILLLVCFISYFDITVWGKDIFNVLFGSRIGELISLGIGMRIINYLILGIALILSGWILLKKERR